MLDPQARRIEQMQGAGQLHQVPGRGLSLGLVIDGREIGTTRSPLEQDRAERLVVTDHLGYRQLRMCQRPKHRGIPQASARAALVA